MNRDMFDQSDGLGGLRGRRRMNLSSGMSGTIAKSPGAMQFGNSPGATTTIGTQGVKKA